MTTQTLQPPRHISTRTIGLGIAGAALAVAAGIGVAALVVDDPVTTAPSTTVREGPAAQPGSDAYDGTNREVRGLMHRNTAR